MDRAHERLLDRNYRYQRHIYDLTREYYLLGRDRMIEHLSPPDGGERPGDRLWDGSKSRSSGGSLSDGRILRHRPIADDAGCRASQIGELPAP